MEAATNTQGFQRKNPGSLDAVLIRTFDKTGISGKLRVSFGEFIAYGSDYISGTYDRAFYFGGS